MTIGGFIKTSLLDYPGNIASTIFMSGCNYRCPFCHNADLAEGNTIDTYSKNEILDYLKKRKKIIEGVCITGGEPSLSRDLLHFMSEIKDLGFLIKLDTNGSNVQFIKTVHQEHLIDYVAMDIKNSREKYGKTCGIPIQLSHIENSIDYIRSCGIDYEFRTTIVKEYHTPQDIINIGEWLSISKAFYLQQYVERSTQFKMGLHAYSDDVLKSMAESVTNNFEYVGIRGIE